MGPDGKGFSPEDQAMFVVSEAVVIVVSVLFVTSED
jgi:hypothetical protein